MIVNVVKKGVLILKSKCKKVYIIGEARGAYRTQNFIKMILDNTNEYKLFYNSFTINNPIIRYLRSFFTAFLTIAQSNIVYVTTLNVDINIFYELLISKIFCKKIIVEYYVSVYDTVILDRKLFKDKGIMASIAKLMDKYFMSIGSVVVFLNETERDRYCSLIKENPYKEKFRIVPLCSEKLGEINSKFVAGEKQSLNICWWGTYLPLHGLFNIMDAIKILQEKQYQINFYFLGNDESKGKKYREYAQDSNLQNYEFIDTFTFKNGKMLPFLQENCDLALGNFGDSDKAKNVLVNKIVDATALKVNLLTCYSKAVNEFFSDKNIYMCSCNPIDIAAAIEKIYHADKVELKNRILSANSIYQNNFSVNVYLDSMKEIINELYEKKSH